MDDLGLVITRTLAVYDSLTAAEIACAIGGALCLNFHTDDPRATRDIDVNITLEATQAEHALRSLPPDVPWGAADVAAIHRDAQVRLWWPIEGSAPLPLDLFFAASDFHQLVAGRTIEVPLRGRTIKILSATDLATFKALFNRPKDWVDIEAMRVAHDSRLDLDEAADQVALIVGPDDARVGRLRALI